MPDLTGCTLTLLMLLNTMNEDLEVFYESGSKQEIKVKISINPLGENKVIDFEGVENRKLKKIASVYKMLPDRNYINAYVEVWGLKTNSKK
jgi:hypothetical protein